VALNNPTLRQPIEFTFINATDAPSVERRIQSQPEIP
jgi:hypothetical protein